MSLLTDIQGAVTTVLAKVAVLVTQTGYLVAVITGPASGTASLVNVGPRTLKTLARVLYEIALSHTFTAKGVYNSATTYAAGDAVSYGSVSYVSIQDGNLNNTPPSNLLWWMVLASPATTSSINVLDFGAVPGLSGSDATNVGAFQAAIDAANDQNGGTIVIPIGDWWFPSGAKLNPGFGNIIFEGQDRNASVLHYHEGTDSPATSGVEHLFRNLDNVAKGSLTFRSLQFRGTLDTRAGRWANPLFLDYYTSVLIDACTFQNIAAEAMDFHFLGQFICQNSHFEHIAGDGVRVRDTSNCIVTGNTLRRIGDNAVALHTSTPHANGGVLRERIIVTDNIITNAAWISILGPRKVTVSRNILSLMWTSAIVLWSLDGVEGGNPALDLVVQDNIINDVVPRQSGGTPAISYIQIQAPSPSGDASDTNGVIPGRYDSGSGIIIKPWDWSETDLSLSDVMPVIYAVNVSGNVCRRTRKAVAAFSDFGYGTQLDEGVAYDGAVTETAFRTIAGLDFAGAVHGAIISGNIVEHTSGGISFAEPEFDGYHDDVIVSQNTVTDFAAGALVGSSATYTVGITICDNNFDGDPYRVHANSNINGTYDAFGGGPNGIQCSAAKGLTIARNTFKNCETMLSSNDDTVHLIEDNIGVCGVPSDVFFNTGNKGIGNIVPYFGQYRYVIQNCDPTSGSYGALSSQMVTSAAAAPASGWYYRGWIVWKQDAASAGKAGFICTAHGSPGTWKPFGVIDA